MPSVKRLSVRWRTGARFVGKCSGIGMLDIEKVDRSRGTKRAGAHSYPERFEP